MSAGRFASPAAVRRRSDEWLTSSPPFFSGCESNNGSGQKASSMRGDDEMLFPGLGSLLSSPERFDLRWEAPLAGRPNVHSYRGDSSIPSTPPRGVPKAFTPVESPSPGLGGGRRRSGSTACPSSRSPAPFQASSQNSSSLFSPAPRRSSSLSSLQHVGCSPSGTTANRLYEMQFSAPPKVSRARSPGEAEEKKLPRREVSPGEIEALNSSRSTCSATEVARLKEAAAVAMRASCEEIAALRAENERLRAAHQAAEGDAAKLRRKLQAQQEEARAELVYLQAQLSAALRQHRRNHYEEARPQSAAAGGGKIFGDENKAPGAVNGRESEEEILAKKLAILELQELEALTDADAEKRAHLRRRLQLKWHPDKNAHNAEFATRVLQEMQRQPAWQ